MECQLKLYKALEADAKDEFHLLEHLCCQEFFTPESVKFLREDESFIICSENGHGIECGMHGHLGPNGLRGNPAQFARMGRRANTGHTHSTGIHDGIYTSGTMSLLDMIYNKGPSSWSHSEIVTYPNGKRAIVTFWEGGWRAEDE